MARADGLASELAGVKAELSEALRKAEQLELQLAEAVDKIAQVEAAAVAERRSLTADKLSLTTEKRELAAAAEAAKVGGRDGG